MARKGIQWGVACLAMGVIATAVALGQNAMQAEPTAVAVVNVQKVFNSIDEKQAINAKLNKRSRSLSKQQKSKKKKLQQMRSKLDVLKPGSEQYKQQQSELERQMVDSQAWQKFEKQKLEQFRSLQMKKLYRKIADAAGRVAKDNGYDLVLYDEGDSDFNFQSAKQLSTMIQMRKVLWSREGMQLTEQVITRMNNQFQSEGGG